MGVEFLVLAEPWLALWVKAFENFVALAVRTRGAASHAPAIRLSESAAAPAETAMRQITTESTGANRLVKVPAEFGKAFFDALNGAA